MPAKLETNARRRPISLYAGVIFQAQQLSQFLDSGEVRGALAEDLKDYKGLKYI